MKEWITLFLSFLLLTALAACGQETVSLPEASGEPGQSAPPDRELDPPGSEPEEIAVTDAYIESEPYYPKKVFSYYFDYEYHIPEIQRDAPGARTINEEIRQIYEDLVLTPREAGETPECTSISYEYYQSEDVLSLVLSFVYGPGDMEEYAVYHYDIEQDKALLQEDLPALLGVSREALETAVARTAAQSFDENYHADAVWWYEEQFETLSMYFDYRAAALSRDYLSQALVYLGEGGQPRTIFPRWTYGDPEFSYCDKSLDLTPGETGKLEDDLLDVAWDNTGGTIRFHGDEASQDFWGERFGCGWLLEYDKDLPVAGLYSRYTEAAIHMDGLNDPPILFLLTDQGRVEYVDLVACMRGGYLCGGGPLMWVENVTGLTGAEEPGYSGSHVFAQCKDGSKEDLSEALTESRGTVPEVLEGSWEAAVTYRWADGETAEIPYTLTLHTDGWMEGWMEFQSDSEYFDKSVLSLLGETGDGVVYQYCLYPDETLEADGVPYRGTVAFRTGYDQDAGKEALYVTTLSVDVIGILDDTPGGGHCAAPGRHGIIRKGEISNKTMDHITLGRLSDSIPSGLRK